MITASRPALQPVRWQQLWREAISDPRELLAALDLGALAEQIPASVLAAFALRVPRGFVARMRRGDRNDPLLRQVLPLAQELDDTAGFALDAVGDLASRNATGVLHKYQGRALLIATGSCAVNCRYCFRRHFPYAQETAAADRWRTALDYLAADPGIHEVILSGGDPLSLSTARLGELSEGLRGIAHIKTLRIHTRLPVVLPERVDEEFLAWLRALPWRRIVVIHSNHGNELDANVGNAVAALRKTGATVLNQSVLLRGVNDSVTALQELSERLFDWGVLPYYLHQLDRVGGTAHFEVPDVEAIALVEGLRSRLPGYLVPRLVREVAGAPSKLALPAGAVIGQNPDRAARTDNH